MHKRIIIALDFADELSCLSFLQTIDPSLCRVKVGKELFVRCGPALVEKIHALGFEVFLDLKFHDIPNTVAAACRSAAAMGVWMVNVHASGGKAMMEAAHASLQTFDTPPLLIAVTVLTSFDQAQFELLGYQRTLKDQVLHLAHLTQQSGLDGVVCSPLEAAQIRQLCGSDFKLVTPGVRPSGSAVNDQQRIMTPQDAIKSGADYLVIGRPITQHPQPDQQLRHIQQQIEQL